MLLSLEEVRVLLPQFSEVQDLKIEFLLEAIEETILKIRNKEFDKKEDGTIIYTSTLKKTAIEMLKYDLEKESINSNVESESLGDFKVKYRDTIMREGYPAAITSGIEEFGRNKWVFL